MFTVFEPRTEVWLCLGLAFIGGYADAASYTLAGIFTGHITGNTILAAISLVTHDRLLTISRLLAIAAFLLGILLSLVVEWIVNRKPSRSPLTVALFLEAILLFMAAGFAMKLDQILNQAGFVFFMCLALGLQNGAFRKAGGISVHTTFITGIVTTLMEHEFSRIVVDSGQRRLPTSLLSDPTFRLISAVWLTFFLGAGVGGGMGLYFKNFAIAGIALLSTYTKIFIHFVR